MKTHYEVLGLLPHAEDVVVKAAYKALAQKFHPDKHKGQKEQYTELMARINTAYEVLGHKELRQKYDQLLEQRAQRKAKADKAKAEKAKADSAKADRDHTEKARAEKAYAEKAHADRAKAAKQAARQRAYAALVEQLRHNTIDEVTTVKLYEEVFKCNVTINNGWINTYTVKSKNDKHVLNFSSLKAKLLTHFSEGEE